MHVEGGHGSARNSLVVSAVEGQKVLEALLDELVVAIHLYPT